MVQFSGKPLIIGGLAILCVALGEAVFMVWALVHVGAVIHIGPWSFGA